MSTQRYTQGSRQLFRTCSLFIQWNTTLIKKKMNSWYTGIMDESKDGWSRKSNLSVLKEINPECSLEGLMVKLKLQYFGPLMWRTDSLGKTLMLRKIEGRRKRGDRGWDGWMASLTQWTWVWANSRSWWWTGRPGVLQSMGSWRAGHNWANWTIITMDKSRRLLIV